jgi:hypothetical protein
MQVATTEPQILRGFLAVGSNIVKVLTVIALHKASVKSV